MYVYRPSACEVAQTGWRLNSSGIHADSMARSFVVALSARRSMVGAIGALGHWSLVIEIEIEVTN